MDKSEFISQDEVKDVLKAHRDYVKEKRDGIIEKSDNLRNIRNELGDSYQYLQANLRHQVGVLRKIKDLVERVESAETLDKKNIILGRIDALKKSIESYEEKAQEYAADLDLANTSSEQSKKPMTVHEISEAIERIRNDNNDTQGGGADSRAGGRQIESGNKDNFEASKKPKGISRGK